ncbi:MAG: murein transglycosylase A [Oceanicaulis sp.]
MLSACASGPGDGPAPASPRAEAPPRAAEARPARPAARPHVNPVSFDSLSGWPGLDTRPALAAFVQSCRRIEARPDPEPMNPRAPYAGSAGDWRGACLEAAMLDTPDLSQEAARAFFERNFAPVRVRETGRLTGYYEPYVEVRSQPDREFSMAIRARPGDLLTGDLGQFIAGHEGRRIVGRAQEQAFTPYLTRAEIERENLGVPLAWGRPIDVFFLQIQGSGRLLYPDGGEARARFAAHNGRDYVSIGRILIARGELDPNRASKQDIEAWLDARGPLAWRPLFDENPRYVFFSLDTDINPDEGPIGSQGAPLTPMASLAIDPAHHAWGVPVFLEAAIHGEPDWRGLVVAQDAGGAITGPARGDLFFGWGYEAGERAGRQNDPAARWTLLLPNHLTRRH